MAGSRVPAWCVLPIVAVLAACGAGGLPSATAQGPVAEASPSNRAAASPTAVASVTATGALATAGTATFEVFRDGFCAGWTSIFTAVGNPDTGGGSDLSRALDAAVKAGDVAAANQAAAAIQAELAAGRRQVQAGAGWAPAAPFMAQLDRFLAAYEAGTEAERAAAGPAGVDGRAIWQAAFQAAGGIEAWQAMPAAAGPIASARPHGSEDYQCPGIPVSV